MGVMIPMKRERMLTIRVTDDEHVRLEQLQQDYMQRLNEWESAFVELQKMFSLTQRDNAMLNERVMQLSQQVQHLSEQTERLSQLYSENWR